MAKRSPAVYQKRAQKKAFPVVPLPLHELGVGPLVLDLPVVDAQDIVRRGEEV